MTTQNNNINLQNNKGKNPFAVPDNYFENFESKMMDRINQEEGNFKVPVVKMMRPYLYIAAGFLLLFTIGRFVITSVDTGKNSTVADNLTIEQEMELIYSEVDEFTITDYLLEADMENIEEDQ